MKLLLLAVACIFLAMTAHADTISERREVAIKVVEALRGAEVNVETFRKTCMTNMEEESKKHHATPEEMKLFRKVGEKAVATVTRERLVEAMAEGYAIRLSLDELKGVLAFYESPSGKALRREQGYINKETEAQMKILVAEMVKDITARYDVQKKEPKE